MVIVAVTYGLAMLAKNANVFDLAIWCFSGFSALFPVIFAALYWKRTTKQGAIASIIAALLTWLIIFMSRGTVVNTWWGRVLFRQSVLVPPP